MVGSSTERQRSFSEPEAVRHITFEAFALEEGTRLFRALFLMTGSRSEAEDVMQDAFLAVWERWDRVASMDDPSGYLYRTALNLWRKRLRRARIAIRRAVQRLPDDDAFSSVDARDAVFQALRRLSDPQRAAIVATSLLGYTSDEAGRLLGMSPSSVRMHASRGRRAMRRSLEVSDDR